MKRREDGSAYGGYQPASKERRRGSLVLSQVGRLLVFQRVDARFSACPERVIRAGSGARCDKAMPPGFLAGAAAAPGSASIVFTFRRWTGLQSPPQRYGVVMAHNWPKVSSLGTRR